MTGPSPRESFNLSVVRYDDGTSSLYFHTQDGGCYDGFSGERLYAPGGNDHQVCDEATRLFCSWCELGALGLSRALENLRFTDRY